MWTGTVYVNIFKGTSQGINQCGTAGSNCEKFQATTRVRHPQYNSGTTDYDYLLVKLSGESLQDPLRLVDAADGIANNDQFTTLGFGTTSAGGSTSTNQLEATVDFKNAVACRGYGYSANSITDRMNCGYTPGKDACQGDSGGPFIQKGSASDGSEDLLVGIVSWGSGCGSTNYPGVYADVLNQRSWIVQNACAMTGVEGPCRIGERGTAAPTTTPAPTTIKPTITTTTQTTHPDGKP